MPSPPTQAKIGVVLVNWNTARLTKDCVDSLQRGTRVPDVIVVVDNNSASEDRAVLDALPGVKVIHLDRNTGFTGANNVGIRHLLEEACDLIWILNNDTVVDTACLERLTRHLAEHPETGVVTGKIFFADPPDVIWFAGGFFRRLTLTARHRGAYEKDAPQYEVPARSDFITGCCMLVRADVWRRVGEFHPAFFAYSEDSEWCLRARAAGVRCMIEPAAKLWHRVGASLLFREKTPSETATHLLVRNAIYVIRLHAAWWQRPFALVAMLRNMGRTVVKAPAARRSEVARSVWRAVREGFRDALIDVDARGGAESEEEIPRAP